jgi:hypothetical protein
VRQAHIAQSAVRRLNSLRRCQTIEAKPVPRISQPADAAEYRGYHPETGTAGNQEHDQDLVFVPIETSRSR